MRAASHARSASSGSTRPSWASSRASDLRCRSSGHDAGDRSHDLFEGGVGDRLAEGPAPPAMPTHAVVGRPKVVVQLLFEPGLADARLADDRHEPRRAVADRALQ